MANVAVGETLVRDHGVQFIGNTTISTFYQGSHEDNKAQRGWKEVISWISPSEEALKLQNFIENESRSNHKLDKAGSWFIENEQFRNWIQGRSKRIWVNGAMGCGKTVLFHLAVEEVRKICQSDEHKRLARFYCTSRDPLGQDLATLFKSLLRQFCSRESIPIAIQTLYESCDRGIDWRSPTAHELASCLREVVCKTNDKPSATGFYLLIDGLDELAVTTMNELLNELKPIFSSRSQNVYFLLVSRNHKEIELSIDDTALWDKLPLDTVCVQEDIEQFVLSEIAATTLLRRLPQDLQADIVDRVANQSRGMFRWAFLQMQSLKALKPPVRGAKVRDKLKSLPQTLDQTYDEMLQSRDDCDQPLAQRALQWLVFSSRSLYMEELIDAVAIDLEAAKIRNDILDPLGVEALLKDFIQVHPPLSQDQEHVAPRTHRVVLAHASIQEYLLNIRDNIANLDSITKTFQLESTQSNIILAQSCLVYLLCFNTYELRHRHQEFPLLRYAWYYWEQHFTGLDLQGVKTILTAGLRRKAPKILALIKKHIRETPYDSTIPFRGKSNDSHHLNTLTAIIDGVGRAAKRYRLDVRTLPEALNVPYFHPAYDDFCPSGLVEKPFSYKPLTTHDTWIRFVEALPAIDPATPVFCRLVTCKLEDAPPYAALSYVWSTVERSSSIILEGHTLNVKEKQFMMLQSMRSRVENENPAVWMDILCINMMDDEEKRSQISLMPMIFRQAREVVVHMDKGISEDSVHLLARLCTAAMSGIAPKLGMDQRDKARHMITAMGTSSELLDLFSIFNSRLWTRAWNMQEMVCATKAVVLVESSSFSFDIVEQVMRAENFITNIFKESAPAALKELKNNRGWQTASQIARTRIEYQQGMRIELPTLLWRFRNTDTTDKMDKLLSLLAICVPGSHYDVSINYSRTHHDAALDTCHWFLRTYRSLDFLDARSAYEPDSLDNGVCSWVLPFWNLRAKRHPLDLGVFRSADQTHIYAATGAVSCTLLVSTNSPQVLGIQGLVFDKIGAQPEPSRYQADCAVVSETWFTAIGHAQATFHEDKSLQKTMEARWRTVTANQWPLGEALGTATLYGTRIPPETEDEEQALLQMIDTEFDLPLLHGRRLIITREGRLGLVPAESVEGDFVVLLTGGSTPYILRRIPTGQYRFIGSCYVHGCMNGEVIEPLGQNWYTETFEII